MKLYLANAIGCGSTELAAFDAALVGAGVASFNPIRLNSVIPSDGKIVEVDRCPFAPDGWCQDCETGRDLFVEHGGPREQDMREQITASLLDLQAIRELDLGPIHGSVLGATCTAAPTCAPVIRSCDTEPWPLATTDHRRGRAPDPT